MGFQCSFLPSGSTAGEADLAPRPALAFAANPALALPLGATPLPFGGGGPDLPGAAGASSDAGAGGPAAAFAPGGGGGPPLPFPLGGGPTLPLPGAGGATFAVVSASAGVSASLCTPPSLFGGSTSGSSLQFAAGPAAVGPTPMLFGGGASGPFPLPFALAAFGGGASGVGATSLPCSGNLGCTVLLGVDGRDTSALASTSEAEPPDFKLASSLRVPALEGVPLLPASARTLKLSAGFAPDGVAGVVNAIASSMAWHPLTGASPSTLGKPAAVSSKGTGGAGIGEGQGPPKGPPPFAKIC
mmetsp:Transcript_2008/g.4893  ORF Transcript_2008/g.4893 Transcript_2008/m.4893 type:complete len:300 (-) Transcript_2008:2281-3180(-)